jgi:MFS transporter, Spinster family, sphingosine-1-phosphate transporter
MRKPSAALPATDSAESGGWYSGSPARQWRLVIVLLVMTSLGAIDRQVITLLVNPIREALRITDVEISLIVGAAFALSNTLFTLPAGYLADRLSRRGLIAGGALIWSLFTMACGAAGTFARMFLCRIGVGFGESVIQPCALSMLRAALSPQRRGRGFAVQAMAALGGSALALMVGGLSIGLIQRSGIDHLPVFGHVQPWQIALIFVGLLGLPAPLLLSSVREPPRGGPPSTAPSEGIHSAIRLVRGRASVYIPLLAFQLGMTLLSLSYAAWVAAMIGRSWHLSYAQIGTWVGLMMLALPPIGLWTWGHLIDYSAARLGVRGPVLVGLVATVLVGLAASAAPLAPTLPLFWLGFGSLMLVAGTVFPINATITASITPAESMGSISGLQFFAVGLVAAGLGPTLVAAVSEALFEGPRALANALSLTSGVYALIGLVALGRVYQTIDRPQTAEAVRKGVEA